MRVNRLAGKTAIVSGAGQQGPPGVGNGRATSILFAREGASCLLVDRDPTSAEETRRLIHDEGGEASVFVADITREETGAGVVAACLERYGAVDILHNNVGSGESDGTAVDVEWDAWDRGFALNVKGAVWLARSAIPAMQASGGGSIINVSSIAAIRYLGNRPPRLVYAASKAALLGVTQHIAGQYGRDNIRCNAILPGYIDTPMTAQTDEQRRERAAWLPIQRQGTAWDVAWAAVFLGSDESRFLTGHFLVVDGGLAIQGRTYE